MEFLRFGGRISGNGIGCCAFDIIQGFNEDPDGKYALQRISGDGAYPLQGKFVGPTYKDVFYTMLRTGSFDNRDMPNHGFLAIITEDQLVNGGPANKWLAILKECGFEFVRAVDNSVYSSYPSRPNKPNYLFALFRNVEDRGVDPFAPPEEWTKLPENKLTQKEVWDKIGPPKFITEEEARKMGAPVYLAGTRGEQPKLKPIETAERKNPWGRDESLNNPTNMAQWDVNVPVTPKASISTGASATETTAPTIKPKKAWAQLNENFNLSKVPV